MISAVSALIGCAVIDDAGNHLQFNKPAERVVSLAPDLTESLFSIGAGNRVIGVVGGCDYPLAAKKIPRIGSYSGIDLEAILSLHPDLIVVWNDMFSRDINKLKKCGIPVYVSRPRYLEDVPRTLKNLGCLTGTVSKANSVAAHFSQQLISLQQQYQQRQPVNVFYQIGSSSLLTINQTSWINQVIALCGGRNIFSGAKTAVPEVTWEAVVVRNPQVVISDATDSHWRDRWQRWLLITAVKEKKLFSIDPDLIDRAGPRLSLGVAQVCEDLQKARS